MKTSAADAQRSRKRANDKTKIRCQSLWSQKRSESLLSSTGIPAPNTWTTRISCQRSISQRAFYDEILTIIQLFSISLEKTRQGVLQFSGQRLKKKKINWCCNHSGTKTWKSDYPDWFWSVLFKEMDRHLSKNERKNMDACLRRLKQELVCATYYTIFTHDVLVTDCSCLYPFG